MFNLKCLILPGRIVSVGLLCSQSMKTDPGELIEDWSTVYPLC